MLPNEFLFCCFQGVFYKGYYYALDISCTAIWKLDLTSRKACVESKIDNKDNCAGLFSTLLIKDNIIILLPGKTSVAALYDLDKKRIEYIELKVLNLNNNKPISGLPLFFEGTIYDNDVYIIGAGYPAILRIQIASKDNNSIVWDEREYTGRYEKNNMLFFSHGRLIDEKYLYITGGKYLSVFRIDTESVKCVQFDMEKSITAIYGIIKHLGDIWILVRKDTVLELNKWEENTGVKERIIIDESCNKSIQFWNPLEVNGNLFIFPTNGNNVYRINIEKRTVDLLNTLSDRIGEIPDCNAKYLVRIMGVIDNRIIFVTNWNRKWYEYNVDDGSIMDYFVYIVDEDYSQKYWKNVYEQNCGTRGAIDERIMPLNIFIKNIV